MARSDQNDFRDSDAFRRRRVHTRFGGILILISGVLWFSLFAIPFLPLPGSRKVMLAGAVFVGVQLTWRSGAALVGPRVIQKLAGWFRNARNRPSDK